MKRARSKTQSTSPHTRRRRRRGSHGYSSNRADTSAGAHHIAFCENCARHEVQIDVPHAPITLAVRKVPSVSTHRPSCVMSFSGLAKDVDDNVTVTLCDECYDCLTVLTPADVSPALSREQWQ